MKKRKIAFIINPNSGRSSKKRLEDQIRESLDLNKFTPFFHYTQFAGHASTIALECHANGIDTFVAVGGDGTINEVARTAINTGAILGILPTGSGNGLARHLNIPIQVKPAIELINKFKSTKIDVGQINNRYFLTTCGAGFDAKIGHKFSKQKKRGFRSYLKTSVQEFKKYKPKKYKVILDGEKFIRKAFLFTIANANQYGNNAQIAPQAEIDDGFFDVCMIRPFPIYKAPLLGIRLFSKTIGQSSYYETIQCRSIVIKNKKKLRFHIDGDPIKLKGDIHIFIEPQKLKVITG